MRSITMPPALLTGPQINEVDAEFEAGRADAKAGRQPIIDLDHLPADLIDDLGAIAYHAGYDTGTAERNRRPSLTALPGGVG